MSNRIQHTRTPLAYMSYGNGVAFAAILKRCDIVNKLVSNGASALHVAAGANDAVLCRQLVKHGADVNIRSEIGETPLDVALRYNSKATISYLQLAGATENERKNAGEKQDVVLGIDSGIRLLSYSRGAFFVTYLVLARQEQKIVDELQRAVGAHLFRYVEHLLATGVPTSLTGTDGQTALHHAARHGHVDICKLLIDRTSLLGVNYQDRRGNTPIHIAAIYGQDKVIQALIERGVDSSISNTDGLLAKDLAISLGHIKASMVCNQSLGLRETYV